MEEKIKIKKIIVLNDIEKILKKFDNGFHVKISEKANLKEYSHKLYKFAHVYGAFFYGECIGFISFYINKDTNISYLTLLAVEEKFQGKKVSQRLFEKYEEISFENNMKILKLEVFNENVRAVKFYKKNGFEFSEKSLVGKIYMVKKRR